MLKTLLSIFDVLNNIYSCQVVNYQLLIEEFIEEVVIFTKEQDNAQNHNFFDFH